MSKLEIPHNAFIFVGDGRKALFLRNAGDEKYPNFTTERVFIDDNPPTHEQGTDRPGRAFTRAGSNRSAEVAATDWHDLEEHRFVSRIAAALEKLVRERKVTALVVAAPPRTLADLRHGRLRLEPKCRTLRPTVFIRQRHVCHLRSRERRNYSLTPLAAIFDSGQHALGAKKPPMRRVVVRLDYGLSLMDDT